jgi:hypothetical protein
VSCAAFVCRELFVVLRVVLKKALCAVLCCAVLCV